MSQERWDEVDRYLDSLLAPADPALVAALAASQEAGLPEIAVTPTQGKLLWLLARAVGARRILEIGTLGAYSAIWLARALPRDGRLITLEADPKHAQVARANLERAGLDRIVEVRLGRALDILPTLGSEGAGPFDLTFIDADKVNNPEYFAWALRYSRPGSLIVVDNVIREGEVADAASTDPSVMGTRRLIKALATDPHVAATALQTVGTKGWDGLAIALVTSAVGTPKERRQRAP